MNNVLKVSYTTHLSSSHSEMSIPGGVLLESETLSPLEQMRQRWENLNKDQSTKLQLSLNSLEQDQLSPVHMPCVMDCDVFQYKFTAM